MKDSTFALAPDIPVIHRRVAAAACRSPEAAWYQKTLPTFSDALAQVRRCLWRQMSLMLSHEHTERQRIPARLFAHLGELLAHAA